LIIFGEIPFSILGELLNVIYFIVINLSLILFFS